MSIRKIRKKLGLSQLDFSKGAGIGRTTLCGYELNERTPSIIAAYKIIDFVSKHKMKITLEDIYPRPS